MLQPTGQICPKFVFVQLMLQLRVVVFVCFNKISILFSFFFLTATPVVYGSSRPRRELELQLWAVPQLAATLDP